MKFGLRRGPVCGIIDRVKMPALAAAVLAATLAAPAGAGPGAASSQALRDRAAELEEYTALLASLALQALEHPRLAEPFPCLPHWLASNDHVVVAVSDLAAGRLHAGDRLHRIGRETLTGRSGGVWDAAMRALPPAGASYVVEVVRDGITTRLMLPCAPERAKRLHAAERAMWAAAARRDWSGCIGHGREMRGAFGTRFSPPLMIMARCASAWTGTPDPAISNELGHALLAEMVAHPSPSPDLREQLLLTLKDLETAGTEGDAYAAALRAAMNANGVAWRTP